MKLTKKSLIALMLILIISGVLFYFLPDIGYIVFFKSPSIELIEFKGENIRGDNIIMIASLNVTNNADLGIELKSASADIYYQNQYLATANLNNTLQIGAHGSKVLNATIMVNKQNEALKSIIQEILRKNSTSIDYKIKALVSASFLFLNFQKQVEFSGVYKLNLNQFVKAIGWKIEVKKVNLVGKEGDSAKFNVTIAGTNLSSLDVSIKGGDIAVYYKGYGFAYGNLNNQIDIKSNETKLINVILDVRNFTLLKSAIQELIVNKAVYFDYVANLNVFSNYYLLESNYTIKGRQSYTLTNIVESINVKKIIIDNNKTLVMLTFFNNLGVDFHINDVKANIIYNGSVIAEINYLLNQDVISNSENVFILPINIKDISQPLNAFLNSKYTTLLANVNLNVTFLDLALHANIQFNKTLNLKYEINAQISSIKYLASNLFEIEANASLISDLIDGSFKINSLNFNAFLNNTYLGNGVMYESVNLNLNSQSILKLRIYVQRDAIPALVASLLSNSLIKLNLRDIKLSINVANNTYFLNITNDLVANLNPFGLKVEISDPSLVSLSNDNGLGIRAKVTINISNVYNLPLVIKSASILVQDEELGALGYIYIKNSISAYSQSTITGDFIANIDNAKLPLLIQKAINQKGLTLTFGNITVLVSVLDTDVNIKLNESYMLNIPAPINLEANLLIENVKPATSVKSFLVEAQISINIKNMSISNVFVSSASAQIYYKNVLIGSASISLNQKILSLPFSYTGNFVFNVTDSGASILAREILKQNTITLTVTDIKLSFVLSNIQVNISVPKDIGFDFQFKPDLKIQLYNFTIRAPGNVIDAYVKVSSNTLNLNINRIDSLSADILDENNNKLGTITVISLLPNSGLIFDGVLEAQLTQSGLNSIANKFISSSNLTLYANNINIVAYVNGAKISLSDQNIYIVNLSSNFMYDYNFSIYDINAYPPGMIFKLNITIKYQIINGVNAPFVITKATMDIYNLTDSYLGSAYVGGNIMVNSMKGTLNFTATFNLQSSAAPWFASNLVDNGTVKIKITNIYVTAKFYQYNVTVPIKGLNYTYKTTPVTINIQKIDIVGINLVPLQVEVAATVSVNNPFKFPVKITYISGSNYTITFDVYEAQIEAHPGLYLGYGWYSLETYVPPLTNITLYPVYVVITNPLHLFSPPHGSLLPTPHTQIYVDALNGRAGAKLYDLYFTFKFEKRNIFVKYP